MTNLADGRPGVRFTLVRECGQLRDVVTDSPAIDHFLRVIKLGRSHNTWVSYAHDLKLFFAVVAKPPEAVERQDCLTFIEQQDRAGHATTTVNRRLAALSSLFGELQLYDADRFTQNVVQPLERGLAQGRRLRRSRPGLYRRQPARARRRRRGGPAPVLRRAAELAGPHADAADVGQLPAHQRGGGHPVR